ncbi:hypothetical protein COL922a_011257 [Colletotrichum nupharicola]|nr:hypothetical protein COL922a_011257 [Colletotrichum nupharicola]
MLSTNASFPELDFNFLTKKHRNAGTFQRFEKGPARVHKLGHFGVCVTDFQKTYDFFTSRFNLIPSDFLGHDWLRHRGYENCWGVGRHIMGSQIFDYWYDPSKFIFEHYVDGDQMNSSHPTSVSEASPNGLQIWGMCNLS